MEVMSQPGIPETCASPSSVELTDDDREILSYAERTLANGVELDRWFDSRDRAGDYAERFDVVREFNSDGRSLAFFDAATLEGERVPIMGVVQEMFYDRQKVATGRDIRPQLREFILQYFMRVSHFQRPGAMIGGNPALSQYLRPFDWWPNEAERRVGFGYRQLFYKLRESGEVGKFPADDQYAIVDLRLLGTVYDWIVLKCDIFDFNLSYEPFGASAPKMFYPMKEATYLVLGPQFVRNREDRTPGVLAEYGYGYAFMPHPPAGGPPFLTYGPGHFAAAFQSVHFTLMESGDIGVRAAFIVNRPQRVAKIDIDPIGWSFQLADLMTFNLASRVMAPLKQVVQRLPLRITGVDPIGAYISVANFLSAGRAASALGHSMTVLEKRMLMQHFMQHYEMLINSLLVWRKVVDWTDTESLPEHCRKGLAC